MGEEEIQRKIKTVKGRWPKDSNGEHQKVRRGRYIKTDEGRGRVQETGDCL